MTAPSEAPMRVLSLIAENIKKLRAVEIIPTGNVVTIAGRNGAGKSSVLDSLWWALAGAKHIQAVPIRTGEDKARIRLDLGELIVERKFTASGSTVTVTSADGARYDSPQRMLDALLGALAFDPLAFVSQEPRQQFEALKAIVPLDVDLDDLDRKNKADYDRRTDLNRQAKEKRAQASGVEVVGAAPGSLIDTPAIKDDLTNAARTNSAIESERARRARLESDLESLIAEWDRLHDKIDSLRVEIAMLAPMAEPVAIEDIRGRLDQAEADNRAFHAARKRQALAEEAERLEANAGDLTETMRMRTEMKAEAIAAARMPVLGLAFGDGIVTYGGIPFDQASTAEQLRVSVAIAMAAHPKLRVIRIKEGSLLDAGNLELIADMAREQGYQVWIERVQTDGQVGIVIEDGQVVAVDGQPVGAGAA